MEGFLSKERKATPLGVVATVIACGIVIGALNSADPVQRGSLLAQAGQAAQTSVGSGDSRPNLTSGAPSSCTEAISKALNNNRADTDGRAESSAQARGGTLDNCFGAVITEEARNKPRDQRTSADYQCTGRQGVVTIDTDRGTVTAITDARTAVPMGRCEVVIRTCGTESPSPGVFQDRCEETTGTFSAAGGDDRTLAQMIQGQQADLDAARAQLDGLRQDIDVASNAGNMPEVQRLQNEAQTYQARIGDMEQELSALQRLEQQLGSVAPTPTDVAPAGGAPPFFSPESVSGLMPSGNWPANPFADRFGATSPHETAQAHLDLYQQSNVNTGIAGFGDTSPSSVSQTSAKDPWMSTPAANWPSTPGFGNTWNPLGDGPDNEGGSLAGGTAGQNQTSPSREAPAQGPCQGAACGPHAGNRWTPPPPQPSAQGPGAAGGGAMGAIGQLLSGLAQGAMRAQQQQQAQACSTDPQAYQQQQMLYQQQLQQYQYQMQQYQYQQQMQQQYAGYGLSPQLYGYGPYSAPTGYAGLVGAPQPPAPCTPGGGSAGGGTGQCPPLPQQPSAASCPGGAWQQHAVQGAGAAQCPVWQCVPQAQALRAEITCSPRVADVGTNMAVAFACHNATRSQGFGFELESGTLSGTRTISLTDVPAGANSANYRIACFNAQNQATSSDCTVQIARPRIVSFVAQPAEVPRGAPSLIGWTTTGMRSCVVSSPDMPDFTARNANATSTTGVATTSPLTADVRVNLTCLSFGGQTHATTTTVTVSSSSVAVWSTFDARTNVARGETAEIEWNLATTTPNVAVSLWLYDVAAESVVGLMRGQASTTGTHAWNVPTSGDACPQNTPFVCASDMVNGRLYAIMGALYTPSSAHLGGDVGAGGPDPDYLEYVFSPAPFRFAP